MALDGEKIILNNLDKSKSGLVNKIMKFKTSTDTLINKAVLVFYSRCNKLPQISLLITIQIYDLTLLQVSAQSIGSSRLLPGALEKV